MIRGSLIGRYSGLFFLSDFNNTSVPANSREKVSKKISILFSSSSSREKERLGN
jgi:hypothetical protein